MVSITNSSGTPQRSTKRLSENGRSAATSSVRLAPKQSLVADQTSTQRAIEYLLALKGENADKLLADAGLKPRGTKVQAYDRLRSGVASGKISLEQIQQWLEEVEGWGNHQIHLFDVTDAVCDRLSSKRKAVSLLSKLHLGHLLDAERPLWPEQEPAIFRISFQESKLRVGWAQERIWKRREESEDYQDGDLWFNAYRIQHRRCFHYFELDTVTGKSSLIMSKLPSGDKYSDLKEKLLGDLDPIVSINGLQIVDLRPAVLALESSDKVLRRRLNLITNEQTRIEIISNAIDHDAYDDPSIRKARKQWAGDVAASRGHFFWQITTGEVTRLIGTKLLPRENRFSIEGQCSETEVAYVLQCMRAIS
ncbi:hypothetical protein [Novipirellula caenicola]|uniref:hypothetical protein n=1 Tax=Novipirellula caenicola TaxID=1536901 RepID=UPI0031E6AC7A